MEEERKEQPRKESERKEGDVRRIPVDGKIVTSHCGVPYGTAADGSTSPLHAGRGSFACVENTQEKERRAKQSKRKTPQETKMGILRSHKHCVDRELGGALLPPAGREKLERRMLQAGTK